MEIVRDRRLGVFFIVLSLVPLIVMGFFLPTLSWAQWFCVLFGVTLYERLLFTGLDFIYGEPEVKDDQP